MKDLTPAIEADLLKSGLRIQNAGIVYQRLDGPHIAIDIPEYLKHVAFARDVKGEGVRGTARAGNLRCDGDGQLSVASVGDADRVAQLPRQARRGGSEASAAAG